MKLLTIERREALTNARVPTSIVQLRTADGEVRTVRVPDAPERRFSTEFEVETRDDAKAPSVVRGLGVVFEANSQNLGGFIENIARGAFRKVMARDPDVVISVNHDPNNILGRTAARTAEVREIPKGVVYRVDIDHDDPQAVAWARRIARGDVRGSSFTFTVARDRWEEQEDGTILRTILEIDSLYEMGPVVSPAYLQTDAYADRSAADDDTEISAERTAAGDTTVPEGEPELGDLAGDESSDDTEAREARLRELQLRSERRLRIAQLGL